VLFSIRLHFRTAKNKDSVTRMKLVGRKGLVACVLGLAVAMFPAVSTFAATNTHKAGAKKAKAAHVVKGVRPARTALRTGKRSVVRLAAVSGVASFGHSYGLQNTAADLDLKSSVAFVIDQNTNEILLNKNSQAVLPIASITKLMTALVVTEKGLSLDEPLTVSQDDVAATAGSSSRLALGTQLTRGEMLHLALMASENRAAHVLGRNYPGGIEPFVEAMNVKAHELGMSATRYVEPTGLSSNNQSSAQDLSRLVRAAFMHPIIRDLSTSLETVVPVGRRQVQFRNTNGLVRNPEWEIGLQKTGYISAAGRCLVMQAQLAGRSLIMVLLDSAGKYSRIGDAERIRAWLAKSGAAHADASAVQPR
jgi:D-alanyl-D-alanine endopeptidase (penicillin-binding protein 7)